jgi:hypothetical protein
LYANVPGVAAVSERAYEFFARRRGLLNRVTKFLWGPALEPEHYDLVSWVFLRALGAIYAVAFASLGAQILGLVGHAGILPLEDYLGAAHEALGNTAYWILPTLFWLSSSDTVLIAGTVTDMVLAMLVMLDWGTRPGSSAFSCSTCPVCMRDRTSCASSGTCCWSKQDSWPYFSRQDRGSWFGSIAG